MSEPVSRFAHMVPRSGPVPWAGNSRYPAKRGAARGAVQPQLSALVIAPRGMSQPCSAETTYRWWLQQVDEGSRPRGAVSRAAPKTVADPRVRAGAAASSGPPACLGRRTGRRRPVRRHGGGRPRRRSASHRARRQPRAGRRGRTPRGAALESAHSRCAVAARRFRQRGSFHQSKMLPDGREQTRRPVQDVIRQPRAPLGPIGNEVHRRRRLPAILRCFGARSYNRRRHTPGIIC